MQRRFLMVCVLLLSSLGTIPLRPLMAQSIVATQGLQNWMPWLQIHGQALA